MDQALTDYYHEQYISGMGKTGAAYVLYGVLMELPGTPLPMARNCLKSFEKLLPSRSYTPVSWEIAAVIATQMATHTSATCRDLGLAVLVQFQAFLRTSEVLGLFPEDVAAPGDFRVSGESTSAGLRLRHTKGAASSSGPPSTTPR